MPSPRADFHFEAPDEVLDEELIRAELEELQKRREELSRSIAEMPGGDEFIEASRIFRRIQQLQRSLQFATRQEQREKARPRRATNRSPAYPTCDLERAVQFMMRLHDHVRFAYVSYETSIEHVGYSPRSSSGQRTIAALLHFGLLDERGSGDTRQVRLSKLGRRIARGYYPASRDFLEAVQEAVLQPRVYGLLWERWGGSLPTSEEIGRYLVDELGFNPNAVGPVAEDYRASLVYAALLDRSSKADHVRVMREDAVEAARAPSPEPAAGAGAAGRPLEISIPLSSGERATLCIPTTLSQADFELLSSLLNDNLRQAMRRSVPGEGGPAPDEAKPTGS